MSMCSGRLALVAIAFAGAAGTARAHDLACEQTIDGQTAIVISHYPAKLHFGITIRNIHPTDASTVAAIRAPFLEGLGFRFTPAAPFTIPVGGSAAKGFDVYVGSRKACEALAAGMGAMPSYGAPAYGVAMARLGSGDDEHHGEDRHHGDGDHHDGGDDHGHAEVPLPVNACTAGRFVDSIFVVSFDAGAAECRARIVCGDDMARGDGHGDDGHDGEGNPCDGHGDDGHRGGDDHHGEGGSYGAPAKSGS
jgi:hypothetical protein